MELISIIIPIHNVSKYLNRCVDSVVNQTYKNIEIILVDDGSKDNSGEMCDKYQEEYSNIKVVHKENAGLGFARNTGLEYVTGKYVIFVDGDDYIQKDMVENLYNDLKKANADTAIGGFRRVYSDREVVVANKFVGNVYEGDDVPKEVLVRMVGKKHNLTDYIEMSVWKVLFSMDIISKYNLKFPSERVFISEDIIFDTEYYRYAKRVVMSGDTGYCYCDNEGSLTTKYRSNRFELQKTLYLEMVKRMKELNLYNESKQRLMTTFISVTRYCVKLEQKFANENGKKKAKENIKAICNDEVLQKAFSEYENNLVPIKSRFINNLIIHKNTKLLYDFMALKNKFNI